MLLSLGVHPYQSESVVAGLVGGGVDCCPDIVAEVKKFHLTSRLGQLAIAVGIVASGTSEISGLLEGEDVLNTGRVMAALVTMFFFFSIACIFYIPLPRLERFAEILISNCINQDWPFSTRSWEDVFLSLFIVVPICITLIFIKICM